MQQPDVRRQQGTLRLPHFLVVGAMKCGTTTLRHLLRSHSRIYMPPREIFVFAVDDVEQHAGALTGEDGRWRLHDFDGDRAAYLQWYSTFFDDAAPDQILGEGSTTYMPSEKAPRRIAELIPNARLVFMLRDPVERTYSQYWHLVSAGAAADTFEQMLRRSPASLLQRSLYKAQIERYLARFPAEQLTFVLFEEFIKDPVRIAADVARFVGAEGPLPERKNDSPRNVARVRQSLALQLLRNRIVGARGARDRFEGLGQPMGEASPRQGLFERAADWAFARINPVRAGRPPAMQADTRMFLTELLKRENRGLSELIGIDVERYWYKPRTER